MLKYIDRVEPAFIFNTYSQFEFFNAPNVLFLRCIPFWSLVSKIIEWLSTYFDYSIAHYTNYGNIPRGIVWIQ